MRKARALLEITAAMEEAGVSELLRFDPESGGARETARAVYLAMVKARSERSYSSGETQNSAGSITQEEWEEALDLCLNVEKSRLGVTYRELWILMKAFVHLKECYDSLLSEVGWENGEGGTRLLTAEAVARRLRLFTRDGKPNVRAVRRLGLEAAQLSANRVRYVEESVQKYIASRRQRVPHRGPKTRQ